MAAGSGMEQLVTSQDTPRAHLRCSHEAYSDADADEDELKLQLRLTAEACDP